MTDPALDEILANLEPLLQDLVIFHEILWTCSIPRLPNVFQ